VRAWVVMAAALASACVARAQEPETAPPAPSAAASSATDGSRPKLLRNSCRWPEYPLASVRAEESGTTRLRMVVSEAGVVTEASVEKSSGHRRLDGAAREALALCKFEPGRDTAGVPIRSTAFISYEWRLSDAAPDPWVGVRAESGKSPWPVTEALDAVAAALTTPTETTLEQRTKILKRMQEAAIKHANCGNIDKLTVAPPPADWKFPPVTDPKTQREMRIVREQWRANHCGVPMTYALVMRFPEGEVATFNMVPIPATAPAVKPEDAYAKRVAAAIRTNIAFVGGQRNPVAEVELTVAPDGLITSSRLRTRSGDTAWDDAVMTAVAKTRRLPLDDKGTAPPLVVVTFRPR